MGIAIYDFAKSRYQAKVEGSATDIGRVLKEGEGRIQDYAAGALEAIAKQRGELPKEALYALAQVLEVGNFGAKVAASFALQEVAKQGGKFPEEMSVIFVRMLKEDDFVAAQHAAGYVLRAIVRQGSKFPKEAFDTLTYILKEDNSHGAISAAYILGMIAERGDSLPKEAVDALIHLHKKKESESVIYALKAVIEQGGKSAKEALNALVQVLQEPSSLKKSLVIRTLKTIKKKHFAKISNEAFSLNANICFFFEDSFSIKGQQFQISDKIKSYLSEPTIELSYEEIKKKLPTEFSVWREKLDSLSQIGSTDRTSY
ncbi:hypothetical protein [Parachlamydia sp. AcF125]|uniref:HEAT repeat domain-containing protein n=1 Tax=Parachlamydia sp. AcF125 TaxID=2795736 RepID=UPI001BC9B09A|nr:hypothetical protein [Parachlamydia sp. AcF125]